MIKFTFFKCFLHFFFIVLFERSMIYHISPREKKKLFFENEILLLKLKNEKENEVMLLYFDFLLTDFSDSH